MKILKPSNYIVLFILAAGLFAASCVSVQQTTAPAPSYKYNFSSLYNPGESDLHPEVRTYINTDTSAIVFYRIPKSELRQLLTDPSSSSVKLQIKYVLRDVSTFEIVDSSSFINSINIKETNSSVFSYFHVKIPAKSNYKLIVSIAGQREKSGKRLIMELDNSSVFTQDYFLPEKSEDSAWTVLYDNYVNEEGIYRISSKTHQGASLNFEYYKFQEYVLVPPYYLAKYDTEVHKPDSVFLYKPGDTLTFPAKGIYLMRPSSQSPASVRFINAGRYFPDVMVLKDMLEPLKLLTGNKEYNEISGSEDLKLAIDNFWLSKSENQKIAKEQIRVFYNRVALANKYFTDDKEGWKTDRGIIYVMLGPPSVINMSSEGEEWIYGENPDVAGVLFIFDKINDSWAGSRYVLRRNETYQSVWAKALTTWKNGRIFTITNN